MLGVNLHSSVWEGVPTRVPSPFAMNRDYQIRFTAGFLALLTVAVVTLAWINFRKGSQFVAPDDGVAWVERSGNIVADQVEPNGPGARAGIQKGDQLVAVDGRPVTNIGQVTRAMYRHSAWFSIDYSLTRGSIPLELKPILGMAQHPANDWLRVIAVIYLGIGLYVLFRRWTAPGSTHFYIFCLVSFVFSAFHFTTKLNDFDWTIYWSNIVAWVLQPALFLHFVLTFPEKPRAIRQRPWLLALAYVPGAVLLGRHIIALRLAQASGNLRWDMDRQEIAYGAVLFVVAAAVLTYSYRRATTTILRQQLKWVTRGTILAVVPYTLFYVVPYLM